jgi:YrbI family 3-deoxy-D-manno-octulosonate 8-phosphate phosphatase
VRWRKVVTADPGRECFSMGFAVSNSDIRLLVLDVDGVLTDGGIWIDDAGLQTRRFHIRDGLGIRMWRSVGNEVALLTSKNAEAVRARARMLDIEWVEQGAEDKLPGLERIVSRAGVSLAGTAYMGDDLLDLVALRRVGYPIAVADAVPEVHEVARYVTRLPGGHGAVREAVEHLLKESNRWVASLAAIGADR